MNAEVSARQAADAVETVVAEAAAAGRRPSVLAAAGLLGLSNTTFRRRFPELASRLTELRFTPVQEIPDRTRRATITPQDRRLARPTKDNRELSTRLALAILCIQRLSVDNARLCQELEAAQGVI